jgi:Fe2+ transport system protein FeoA
MDCSDIHLRYNAVLILVLICFLAIRWQIGRNPDARLPGLSASLGSGRRPVRLGQGGAFRGKPAQRLSALGFRAGKTLQVLRRGTLAGPLQVRLGTTDVILRLSEAAQIEVRPVPAGGDTA